MSKYNPRRLPTPAELTTWMQANDLNLTMASALMGTTSGTLRRALNGQKALRRRHWAYALLTTDYITPEEARSVLAGIPMRKRDRTAPVHKVTPEHHRRAYNWGEVYDFIDARYNVPLSARPDRNVIVNRLCSIFGMSRSTAYRSFDNWKRCRKQAAEERRR